MTFDDIYGLVEDYRQLNTELHVLELNNKTKNKKIKEQVYELEQKLKEIEFKLELPYKLFDLIFEAKKEEDISIYFANKYSTIHLTDYRDELYNCVISLDSATYELQEATNLIDAIKDRRLAEQKKQELKQQALAKLTTEEKEVLGL